MIVLASTLSLLTALALAVPTRRAITMVKNISPELAVDLCIVPAGNVVGNGTPVQLAPCVNGGSPWAYDDATGAFSLTGTNQCLDVTNGANNDGTKLQTWECTGGPNQKFTILIGPYVFHSIQWVGSNKCLDTTDGVYAPGTPIQIWDCVGNNNQLYFFPDPRPIKFTATAHPNMCINVAGGSSADGTSLQIATCATTLQPPAQSFTAAAGGFHVFGNSAIDLTNGDQTNGNKLQIWTFFPGNANQQWYYDAATKALHPRANPGKCADVTDGVFADGTKLQIWDCTGGPNQQFTPVLA